MTGPTIESMRTDEGAFLRAVDSETRSMMAELKEDVSRQFSANDVLGTGALATFATNASGSTLNLQSPDVTTARRLRVGQSIDFYTGSTFNGTRTVASVHISTTASPAVATSITITGGNIATTAGDIAVRSGSFQLESPGLPGIIAASGTLQNVDPSTYPTWVSTVLANGGTQRALSENLMQQTIDAVAVQSGEEPDAIVCEHTQRRAYYGLLVGMKRATNTIDLKGGFKALTYNDMTPLLVDRFTPATTMQFINKSHLAVYEMTDWEWADRDGSVLSRIPGQDLWAAFLYKFMVLGTDKRDSLGALTDLNTSL